MLWLLAFFPITVLLGVEVLRWTGRRLAVSDEISAERERLAIIAIVEGKAR
jgi:hypothetical protein